MLAEPRLFQPLYFYSLHVSWALCQLTLTIYLSFIEYRTPSLVVVNALCLLETLVSIITPFHIRVFSYDPRTHWGFGVLHFLFVIFGYTTNLLLSINQLIDYSELSRTLAAILTGTTVYVMLTKLFYFLMIARKILTPRNEQLVLLPNRIDVVVDRSAFLRQRIESLETIESPESECLICYESNSSFKKLKCGHLYHADCVLRWMASSLIGTCPTCRSII